MNAYSRFIITLKVQVLLFKFCFSLIHSISSWDFVHIITQRTFVSFLKTHQKHYLGKDFLFKELDDSGVGGYRGVIGDGWSLDLGWWTHNTVYRRCIVECVPKTCVISLTSVMPTNSIKRIKKNVQWPNTLDNFMPSTWHINTLLSQTWPFL